MHPRGLRVHHVVTRVTRIALVTRADFTRVSQRPRARRGDKGATPLATIDSDHHGGNSSSPRGSCRYMPTNADDYG
jgi:hypothetical protein